MKVRRRVGENRFSDIVVNSTLDPRAMLMRLPRPRFTVRRLMIAVAIVAIFLGVWLWAREEEGTT